MPCTGCWRRGGSRLPGLPALTRWRSGGGCTGRRVATRLRGWGGSTMARILPGGLGPSLMLIGFELGVLNLGLNRFDLVGHHVVIHVPPAFEDASLQGRGVQGKTILKRPPRVSARRAHSFAVFRSQAFVQARNLGQVAGTQQTHCTQQSQHFQFFHHGLRPRCHSIQAKQVLYIEINDHNSENLTPEFLKTEGEQALYSTDSSFHLMEHPTLGICSSGPLPV